MTETRKCVRCKGKTKTGKRCKRRTCVRKDYCFQHLRSVKGLKVAKSNIPQAHRGLFAYKRIKKGKKIDGYYTGRIMLNTKENPNSAYIMSLDKNRIIDANSTQDSVIRYVNDCRSKNKKKKHCKGNNSKFYRTNYKKNAKVGLKSTKLIKRGDEIFASYGRGYWKVQDKK